MKKLILIMGIISLLMLNGCKEYPDTWEGQIEKIEDNGYEFVTTGFCDSFEIGSNPSQSEIKKACYKKTIMFRKGIITSDDYGFLEYIGPNCEKELGKKCDEHFSGRYEFYPETLDPFNIDRDLCCWTFPNENKECNNWGWCEGEVMYWDVHKGRTVAYKLI